MHWMSGILSRPDFSGRRAVVSRTMTESIPAAIAAWSREDEAGR